MVTIHLKDKNNGCLSNEVSIEDVILNQNEIEFEFPNYIDEYGNLMDVVTLPYKDFLFFQNDYEVIIYEHTPIVVDVNEEYVKQQLDYFKNRDLVYVNGGRGYGKTQYEKLQHNWDNLKKFIIEQIDENRLKMINVGGISGSLYSRENDALRDVIYKMQEIEEKNNE